MYVEELCTFSLQSQHTFLRHRYLLNFNTQICIWRLSRLVSILIFSMLGLSVQYPKSQIFKCSSVNFWHFLASCSFKKIGSYIKKSIIRCLHFQYTYYNFTFSLTSEFRVFTKKFPWPFTLYHCTNVISILRFVTSEPDYHRLCWFFRGLLPSSWRIFVSTCNRYVVK